jgi:hypothetical protein
MMHNQIVALASGKPELAIDLANYRTARQIAGDGNLDGATRREWQALADAAELKLVTALNVELVKNSRWPIGMGKYGSLVMPRDWSIFPTD